MRRYFSVMVWMALAASAAAQSSTHQPIRTDRRKAPDHVTEAWLLRYGNPDPNRSWERIAGTVVIARRGKIIRRIRVAGAIRNWAFWRGGEQMAIEAGGLHGPSECFLASVRTGRTVGMVVGSCDIEDPAAPDWVKALAASDVGQSSTAAR